MTTQSKVSERVRQFLERYVDPHERDEAQLDLGEIVRLAKFRRKGE